MVVMRSKCLQDLVYFLSKQLLFHAKMVTSDLEVDEILERDELRYAMTASGAQYVMTHGQSLMGMWPAGSLDTPQQVHKYYYIIILYSLDSSCRDTTDTQLHDNTKL